MAGQLFFLHRALDIILAEFYLAPRQVRAVEHRGYLHLTEEVHHGSSQMGPLARVGGNV